MSWAADNPEAYDELCRKGMVAFLIARIPEFAGDEDDLDWLLSELEENGSALIEKLRDLAQREIDAAMGDHFGGLIDDAKNRAKDGLMEKHEEKK